MYGKIHERFKAMTLRPYNPTPALSNEQRRPVFPIERQQSSLFLGWGPKV